MKKLILVVCKGNIHRSVIAEICIRKNLEELGLTDRFIVESRGLQGSCRTAMPLHPNIRQYTLEWNLSLPFLNELEIEILENKVATPIDRNIAEKASLILSIDQKVLSGKLNSLLNQFPDLGFKMKLFQEMAEMNSGNVSDCAEKTDAEVYQHVIMTIHVTARIGTLKMCQLAEDLSAQPQQKKEGP